MTELSDDQVFGKQPEMSDAQVFGDPMPDALETSVPEAFLDRVKTGQALARITMAAGKGFAEGAGQGTPTGFEDETLNHLVDLGVFHDPLKSTPGPIHMMNEAVMIPAAKAWEAISRATAGGIHGAGGAVEQLVTEFGGSQGTANSAKNEIINAGNWAMIEAGMGRFTRPSIVKDAQAAADARGPVNRVLDQPVGGLPTAQDFTNAAEVLEPKPKFRLTENEKESSPNMSPGDNFSGLKHYDIFDSSDRKAGFLLASIGDGFARIENIEGSGGPNSFGPSAVRSILRQFKELHPDITEISGERISGARFGGERVQNGIETNLRRMWREDGIHPAEAVHDAESDAFLKNEITSPRVNAMAPTSFKTAKGSEYELHEDGTTTRNKAARSDAGHEGDFGLKPRSDKTIYVAPEVASELSGAGLQGLGPKGFRVAIKDGRAYGLTWNERAGRWGASPGGRDIPFSTSPEVGMSPVELWKPADDVPGYEAYRGQHAGNAITELRRSEGMPSTEDIDTLTETGGKPGSLSAAITPPEEIPIAQQPASPPGRLAAAFKEAGEKLLDIGRDAQMLTAPMARGTRASMAIAKDFANSLRRNRWDWNRIDDDIRSRFDAESRARMWNAADEESVSLQLKEPEHMREHQGLSTLEPEERALVDELQSRAQNAWVRAQDVGIVKEGSEGLPSYTPRMVMNIGTAFADDKALPLNSIGNNLKIRTAQMLHRKYLTVEETERAAKDYVGMREALKGKSVDEIQAAIDKVAVARDIRTLPLATAKLEDAIAGRTLINNIKKYGEQTGSETVSEGAIPTGTDTKWFTLDHPAFRSWRPKLKEVDGKMQAVMDVDGNTIFEQVPLYIHGDFEGPLRAVLQHKSGPLYGAMMAIKGKTMSLIMNSPMIHNAVEWGRALPAMPGKVATFKVYFEGNRAKRDVPLMHEAIDSGLVPIGHRFFNQDITSMMETPNLTPGRSFTSQVLGFVPGLFDEGAGDAVKSAIDKAGDFWHNTLLWDRVADLQMGLYTNFRADAMAKGIDQQTASRMAAHFANRYAGALPKEAMSDGATKLANMLMFSRSFTMGNLGVLKDMFTGLPKDIIAQIERDAGFGAGSIEGASPEAAQAVSYAKSMARRKAMSVVAMDMALMYVGNSILQNGMNVMFNDSTLEKEYHGYAERFLAKMQAIKEHPLELVQPLRLLSDLSATSENEPGKQDRIHVGNAANGTAIYMRNPAGKIGEEFIGYMTGPLDMMRKKLGTIARPIWQVMSNDAGFGRKIYDPDADTPGRYLANLGRIVAHIAGSQLPQGQLGAFADLVKGEGDAKVNALQAFGPFAGLTFAKGAPGGMAVGEMYAAKTQHEFQVNQALPDIRRQIQRGDIDGAINRMTELDIPGGLQRFYIRTTLNPATRMSPRAVKDFYLHATPEQRMRFDRARQAP